LRLGRGFGRPVYGGTFFDLKEIHDIAFYRGAYE
jgi:hypothetical protein